MWVGAVQFLFASDRRTQERWCGPSWISVSEEETQSMRFSTAALNMPVAPECPPGIRELRVLMIVVFAP